MTRRTLLALSAAILSTEVPAASRPPARLVIVGGAEDRLKDKIILRRFIELSGGAPANIVLITAASADQAASWAGYQQVFTELGASNVSPLVINSPEDANDPVLVNRILSADGIFMTGGDQRRLMERLANTEVAHAMHIAFHARSCCIGGTSAGAAAMSQNMLAIGGTPSLPEKNAAVLETGLGFVPSAIIDQHFSQRHRLGRLLSTIAQRPDLLGVGIDEDTALVIERDRGIEVIGRGAVTVIDGHQMRTNYNEVESSDRLEMLGIAMHVLPAGNRYYTSATEKTELSRPMPPSLRDAIRTLVAAGPLRG